MHRCLSLSLLGLFGFSSLAFAEVGEIRVQQPLAVSWEENILQEALEEPSGIVYHQERGTLFVVSDDGLIAELALDGEVLDSRELVDDDLEGITVDPATGLLYVAIEGKEQVLEVTPGKFKKRRKFDIERKLRGFPIFPKGGNGIESITFVPNADHPMGGTFWVANQRESGDSDEGSWLAEVVLPLNKKKGGKGRIIRAWRFDMLDISGLQYLSESRRLALISDLQNLYLELSLDGQVLREQALPGYDQEGITVDAEGNIYIAVDGDGDGHDAVMRLNP